MMFKIGDKVVINTRNYKLIDTMELWIGRVMAIQTCDCGQQLVGVDWNWNKDIYLGWYHAKYLVEYGE